MTIDDVLTVSEAAKGWGLSAVAVKKACSGQPGYPPLFKEGECRKTERVWLITRAGMERVYGPQKFEINT